MERKARAKLNFDLAVNGVEGAKHSLDTVIVPIELYDIVTVTEAEEDIVTYDGEERRFDNDTVKRTVALLRDRYSFGSVSIDVRKNIPEGAGVGGSSADAAAVVRALEEIFDFEVDMDLLPLIGSDMAAMYLDTPCRLTGTGREVTPIDIPEGMKFVLIVAGRVGTEKCFATYDRIGGENPDVDGDIKKMQNREYFSPINALYDSAREIEPRIEKAMEILRRAGFLPGMTGSGSGVFGYEYDEKIFSEKVARIGELPEEYEIFTF